MSEMGSFLEGGALAKLCPLYRSERTSPDESAMSEKCH
jgi:hypothetical protein